jgi:magnesium chelatase subunit I
LRRRISTARERNVVVEASDDALEKAARLCVALGVDGLRGELTLLRAARALASFEGEARVSDEQLRRVAPLALGHRLRRNPLDDSGSGTRVARAVDEIFGA